MKIFIKIIILFFAIAGVYILISLIYPLSNTQLVAAKRADTNTVLDRIELGWNAYRSEYGVIPGKANREVELALSGSNPKNIHFVEFNTSISSDGEICDRWKNKLLFIDKVGGLEVRSSGPDQKYFTKDDIIRILHY